MMRLAVFVSICAFALVASTSSYGNVKPLHRQTGPEALVVRPEQFVIINGINYYFGTEGSFLDYASADGFCKALNMTLAGMETDAEWMAVTDYMRTNGLSYWYWTSGQWVTGNWTWTSTGTIFSADDPRWGLTEPGAFDRQGVSIDVNNLRLWAEDFTVANHLVCEE